MRFGSFLPGAASFDAAAFGISGAEAGLMDPQQRLLLHCTAEALHFSGLAPTPSAAADASAAVQWGVWVGISAVDYNKMALQLRVPLTAYSATGSLSLSVAAGRLSYAFGMRGPAVAIDTACSSSLVAIHSGAAALALGHCGTAVCAGSNLVGDISTVQV